MRRRRAWGAVVAAALVVHLGCGTAGTPPPNLTPQARVAWQSTRVIKALDVIRDIAQDGASMTPAAISADAATVVTSWHRSALLVVHAGKDGWQAAVDASLVEAEKKLSASDKKQLTAYVELARVVLKEVQ